LLWQTHSRQPGTATRVTSDKEQRCCGPDAFGDELRGNLRVKTACFRSRPLQTGLALIAWKAMQGTCQLHW